MKTLEQAREESESINGRVIGGYKWENDDGTIITRIDGFVIICGTHSELNKYWYSAELLTSYAYEYDGDEIFCEVFYADTVEEAIIETLRIIKSKITELSKLLGMVCFDKEQHQLDLAEAQLTGYYYGESTNLEEVISSMGLKRDEWLKIREFSPLNERFKLEVDGYFQEDK